MFQIPASRVTAGLVLDGEPIYTVVDHPSGLAFLDYENAPIRVGVKPDEILNLEMW